MHTLTGRCDHSSSFEFEEQVTSRSFSFKATPPGTLACAGPCAMMARENWRKSEAKIYSGAIDGWSFHRAGYPTTQHAYCHACSALRQPGGRPRHRRMGTCGNAGHQSARRDDPQPPAISRGHNAGYSHAEYAAIYAWQGGVDSSRGKRVSLSKSALKSWSPRGFGRSTSRRIDGTRRTEHPTNRAERGPAIFPCSGIFPSWCVTT